MYQTLFFTSYCLFSKQMLTRKHMASVQVFNQNQRAMNTFSDTKELATYFKNILGLLVNELHGAQSFLRADIHSASQEILCLLWNTKVHYRVHMSPHGVSTLSHMNPVHIFPSHSLRSTAVLSFNSTG